MIGSVEQLRQYLNTTGGGAPRDDALLLALLLAANGRLRELTRDRILEPLPALVPDPDPERPPTDTADPVTLEFDMVGRTLRVPDLREVVSITMDGEPYTGEYHLRGPYLAPAWWIRFPQLVTYDALSLAPGTRSRTVAITGRWGPAREPEPHIREAVLQWASRVYHERGARWADSTATPDGGMAAYFRRIPPAIAATIETLTVPGI